MSEKPAAEGGEKPQGKKKSPLLLIIIGGVVLGGAGVGGYLVLGRSSNAASPDQAGHGPKEGEGHGSSGGHGGGGKDDNKSATADGKRIQVITLKPIIVNLKGTQARRFLKVSIGLETDNPEVAKELTSDDLKTQLNDFLIEKLFDLDINDVDSAEGRGRLKRNIMEGINSDVLRTGGVKRVYFAEFVVN